MERQGDVPRYPLSEHAADWVTTPAGTVLGDLTLETLRAGDIDAAELRASPETLRLQARFAQAMEQTKLAEALERGAELTAVPDEVVLELYTALRPDRSTGAELARWAERLEREFGAVRTAALVREAADAYARRALLAAEDA